MRALQRRHVVAAVVVLAAAIGSLGGLMHSMAEAAPDSLPGNCHPSFGELPDICPSLPTDQIDGGRAPYLEILSDGTRRYRFDAVLWNAGGAFELEGRECDSFVCDRLGQRIYLGDGEPGTGGGSELRDIPGRLIFEVGDGHNHFHFENAARYEIVVPNGENIVSSKVGFCMFDTYPDPNAHPPRKWYSANCPRQGSHVEMGIARGWGDYYTAALTFQWIVVTLLEPGAYTMRAEVNPGREFLEANYADNVKGSRKHDLIKTGRGADTIRARAGSDIIKSGSGDDTIYAGKGKDIVVAGKGDDTVWALDKMRDKINCGPGVDRVVADKIDSIHKSCEEVTRR